MARTTLLGKPMSREVYYQVLQAGKPLQSGIVKTPFTVGRQAEGGEPAPVRIHELPAAKLSVNFDAPRKLIAVPLSNRFVPRLAALVSVDRSDVLVIRNIHRSIGVNLANGHLIQPDNQFVVGSDGTVRFPEDFEVRISLNEFSKSSSSRDDLFPSIYILNSSVKTNMPSEDSRLLTRMQVDGEARNEVAVQLVHTALQAFQQPPGSPEFFASAGDSAIKMIDLDRVAVLIKGEGGWNCRAMSFRPGADEAVLRARSFSQGLLAKLEEEMKTLFVEPQRTKSIGISMSDLDRAVASPIVDKGKLVGALYGDRMLVGMEQDNPIGELEASLLEVLAQGISASLTVEREQRIRNDMIQFFSPGILSQLQRDSTLLQSKEVDVSVLFCDIRGFSAVTERIGPVKAISWINDVLTKLSECVLEFDGVLVDYIGDEVMAMWGAPVNQPDHAERACRAALKMLAQIQPLVGDGKSSMMGALSIGIGINSGPACVGNTGSKHKFKYGPIGNTVNVASRVQGITKQLGVSCIISSQTAKAASNVAFLTRRLARTKVVGIEQPIELFQLCDSATNETLCRRYEEALAAFEVGNPKTAAGRLATLVQEFPDDRPTIILLSRTVEQLTQPSTEFDPTWHLSRK